MSMRTYLRRFCAIAAVPAAAWLAGFVAFVVNLPAANSPDIDANPPPVADGIAVYTGHGARIKAAMTAFHAGAGKRLLISGVNPRISHDHLKEYWPGETDQFECCVDLGKRALSTKGNASELDGWAAEHGFASIVLVTSEFHMPRALAETRARMPETEIIPYAITSPYVTEDGAPSGWLGLKTLAGEYSKYLMVLISRRSD